MLFRSHGGRTTRENASGAAGGRTASARDASSGRGFDRHGTIGGHGRGRLYLAIGNLVDILGRDDGNQKGEELEAKMHFQKSVW